MIALYPLPSAPVPHRNRKPKRSGSARSSIVTLSDKQPFETVGNHDICTWAVARDAVWIQVRCPKLARRVAKLTGARRVDKGGHGPFLRLYEVPKDFGWAAEYVTKTIDDLN